MFPIPIAFHDDADNTGVRSGLICGRLWR